MGDRKYDLYQTDKGELGNLIAKLVGIQRNMDKANRTDRKVQNRSVATTMRRSLKVCLRQIGAVQA